VFTLSLTEEIARVHFGESADGPSKGVILRFELGEKRPQLFPNSLAPNLTSLSRSNICISLAIASVGGKYRIGNIKTGTCAVEIWTRSHAVDLCRSFIYWVDAIG
jgi:hypothetical protein